MEDKKYNWSKEIYGSDNDTALLIFLGFMMVVIFFNM
jgi:hypothetical protein